MPKRSYPDGRTVRGVSGAELGRVGGLWAPPPTSEMVIGSPIESSQVQQPESRAGMVATTLAILRLLASAKTPMGVNFIARELALPPSSCFKILKQLQAAEFAEFDPDLKIYSLGSGAIALARRALDPNSAFVLLRPRMEEIAEKHSVTLGLWRRISRSRISLIGFVEGSGLVRIQMSVGQRLPMLMGAVGRAIAAASDMSEAELALQFNRLRWQVPLSFSQYLAEVEEARVRGYAIDRNNFARGVSTVSVAMRSGGGAVGYGLSGIMFSGQHDEEGLKLLALDLQNTAHWAASRLIMN